MNKGELKGLVSEYLKRSDFDAVFNTWVDFATIRIGRTLRAQDNLVQLNIPALANPEVLPADYRAMRSVETVQSSTTYRLQAVESAVNLLALTGSFPVAYRIEGFNLQVRPYAAANVNLAYWASPAPLPTDGSTNAILTAQPMLYLYGTLIEGAIWAQDPASAQGYIAVYENEVGQLNAAGSESWGGDTPVMGVG